MRIPPGENGPTGHVWLLKKALYGLKQASREWYLKVRAELEGMGFTQSEADHGVFIKTKNKALLIIAVYVDDFLLFSKDLDMINKFKAQLGEHFEMKDLGEAEWVLKMQVEQSGDRGTVSLSQSQYVEEILERHGIANCRPVKTPMESNLQLPVLEEPEVDVKEYQRCIGSLMYLMVCTRPDIAHAVGTVACHISAPGHIHMTAVKRIF